ncbi:hypothetical protein C3L33_04410, partial [Rhododendron williamsianum]
MASLPAQSVLSLQILVLFVASVCVHDCIGGVIESRKQREFDYFALALQWPGTYCQRTRHCCSSNACCRGSNAPTEFTIHGLWPDYNDGSWPSCCTRSNFDIEKISTLLDDIQKYWPSLSCGSPSTCHGGKGLFWAHEVNISCGLMFHFFAFKLQKSMARAHFQLFVMNMSTFLQHLTSISSTMSRVAASYILHFFPLYASNSIFANFASQAGCRHQKVLSEAGYVPSNTEKYPLGGVISAIQNAFHATPSCLALMVQWRNSRYASIRILRYDFFAALFC